MAKQRVVNLQFPFGGLDRRGAYRQQPPYTSADLLNVLPRAGRLERARGGNRPGLSQAWYDTYITSPNYPVRMLSEVAVIKNDGLEFWADSFRDDVFSTEWDQTPTGYSAPGLWKRMAYGTSSGTAKTVAFAQLATNVVTLTTSASHGLRVGDWITVSLSNTNYNGLYVVASVPAATGLTYTLTHGDITYAAVTGTATAWAPYGYAMAGAGLIDTTQEYKIELYIPTYKGTHQGKYQILARMNSTTAAPYTDGIIAEFSPLQVDGYVTGSLRVYAAGVLTTYAFTPMAETLARDGWFTCVINGTNVKCNWRGTQLISQNVSAAAGSRFGFGLLTTTVGSAALELGVNRSRTVIDNFRVQYITSSAKQVRRNLLITSVNGSLWRETYIGKLAALSSTQSLATDRQLQAAQLSQKLYIADNSEDRVRGTDGTTDAGGTTFDSASVADWSTKGISLTNDVVVIASGTGATAGTYKINAVSSSDITLSSSAGANATDIVFRIVRAPKIYDPVADTLSIWTATALKGQVPSGCNLIETFRGRTVLAGDPQAPFAWFMSRQGNPLDWDYSGDIDDAQRAVAGTNTEAGQLAEPITALISHTDDNMIFGCTNSLWILRGDPAAGGRIDNLSHNVGIKSQGAWCRMPNGEILFLSNDGLYSLAPGGLPVPLSRDKLPLELVDTDAATHAISMAYDARLRLVMIWVAANTGSTAFGSTQFFYDVPTGTFWPFSPSGDAFCAFNHTSRAAEESATLLGTRTGAIFRFRQTMENDDGVAMACRCLIGPMRLGGDDETQGILNELIGTLGIDSGDVSWGALLADTHEELIPANYAGYTSFADTWVAGRNYKQRPRARGGSLALQIGAAALRSWTLESISAVIEQCGPQRK